MNLTLHLGTAIALTDEQFEQLARANRDVRIERSATGELILMPPTGGETGNRNLEIITDLGIWNRAAKLGVAFDSSTGFRLPNGAIRSPDAAWIRQERWDALTPEDRKRFPPLCPDFVIELCSESDDWPVLQAKMREYVENGLVLGWLIDPRTRQVEVYRRDRPPERLENPASLSEEGLLPGFVLDLSEIWLSE
ncbi:Uma2 family endonuclease [Thermoleptolyngbya sp. C42_A2020_037]|uniref:Uma2 family endonuclease n=1 Tax=Thermoleptolyngbya sp. C42_A2020_037 TaxID=2747799 RepID=UPI001A05702B|nr:Uma2 family endonuclease [Thermoleptolyngbya sp. C42_A2020_037]MBF2083641.1 Uma2 family endonuclease [Thermoleptolyngbya sp. C42_A2020_037]